MITHPSCACGGSMSLIDVDWHIVGWPWSTADMALQFHVHMSRYRGDYVTDLKVPETINIVYIKNMKCTHFKESWGIHWEKHSYRITMFSSRRVHR